MSTIHLLSGTSTVPPDNNHSQNRSVKRIPSPVNQVAQEVVRGALVLLSLSAQVLISAVYALRHVVSYVSTHSSGSHSPIFSIDQVGRSLLVPSIQGKIEEEGQCREGKSCFFEEELRSGSEWKQASSGVGRRSKENSSDVKESDPTLSKEYQHKFKKIEQMILTFINKDEYSVLCDAFSKLLSEREKDFKTPEERHLFLEGFICELDQCLNSTFSKFGLFIKKIVALNKGKQTEILELLNIFYGKTANMGCLAMIVEGFVFKIFESLPVAISLELAISIREIFTHLENKGEQQTVANGMHEVIKQGQLAHFSDFIKALLLIPKSERAELMDAMVVLFTKIECPEQPKEIVKGLGELREEERRNIVELIESALLMPPEEPMFNDSCCLPSPVSATSTTGTYETVRLLPGSVWSGKETIAKVK